MYVCIHIYIFVCVYTYTYVYVYTYMHAYTSIYIHIHMYIYMYVCIYINIHMYIYQYTYIHTYIFMCIYISCGIMFHGRRRSWINYYDCLSVGPSHVSSFLALFSVLKLHPKFNIQAVAISLNQSSSVG